MTHPSPIEDVRPDGSLTPINYLDGKHAAAWAFLMATDDDLHQAQRDLALIEDDELTVEHHAILNTARFFRFGAFLPHA